MPTGHACLLEPPLQGLGYKLPTIVRSHVPRSTVAPEQPQEGLSHRRGLEAMGHLHRQGLPGVLIFHRENFQIPAILQGIQDEIIRPYVVGIFRTARDADALSTTLVQFPAGQRKTGLPTPSPNSLHVELLLAAVLSYPLTHHHLV